VFRQALNVAPIEFAAAAAELRDERLVHARACRDHSGPLPKNCPRRSARSGVMPRFSRTTSLTVTRDTRSALGELGLRHLSAGQDLFAKQFTRMRWPS